jgi:hypothetical protein
MYFNAWSCAQHDRLPKSRRAATLLLLFGAVLLSNAASAAAPDSDHSLKHAHFTPWAPGSWWMQQARSASRSLLQNPDRPLTGFHGRKGGMQGG